MALQLALFLALLGSESIGGTVPDSADSEEIEISAVLERASGDVEIKFSGTGLGQFRKGVELKGVRLTPDEIATSVARIANAGFLYYPERVENWRLSSREGGGLDKMNVIALKGCRLSMNLRIGDFKKLVLFTDCGVVPVEVMEEFEKLVNRAEES